MNYIKLLNQFWTLRRGQKITNLQADLYFFLLQECNARAWENPFSCANGIICQAISVSEPALIRSRDVLTQLGLIAYCPGITKRKSPVYLINAEIAEPEIEELDEIVAEQPVDHLTTFSNNGKKEVEKVDDYLTTFSNEPEKVQDIGCKMAEILTDYPRHYLQNYLTTLSKSVNIISKQNKTKQNLTIDKSIVPDEKFLDNNFFQSEPENQNHENRRKEERKKSCAKKKKEEKRKAQHWRAMVALWFSFQAECNLAKPRFTNTDGAKLRDILIGLEDVAIEKDFEWTEQNAEYTFLKFLHAARADKFLQRAWQLKNIEQNFDVVLNAMLNPTAAKSGNIIQHNATAANLAKEVLRQQRAQRDAQKNNQSQNTHNV